MLDGYFHYIPWRGRMSPFWDNDWLAWPLGDKEDATGTLGDASSQVYFSAYPAGVYVFYPSLVPFRYTGPPNEITNTASQMF